MIILVGLNHRTAPVELREKITAGLQTTQIRLEVNPLQEVVILSTCNRLEVYAVAEDVEQGNLFITQLLAQNVPLSERHLYHFSGDAAIHHLMRVACGLDSMILGETQILGQVTQAYETARMAGSTGAILSHLFAQVIHAGKRTHTETPISRHTTSVSHTAALLVMQKLNPQAQIVIIGAGEMATLAAQALQRFAVRDLVFINRTYARAEGMAQAFDGSARNWFQLQETLIAADAVICATSAPHVVIDRHLMESVLSQRDNRPLVMVDIAVPRDVEDSVRELVQVYDIDDLQSVVDANVELRKAAIPQVEAIIQQEMARFSEWYHSRQVTPVIRTLREWAEGIAEDELTQTLNRLADADDRTRELVSRMAHRLVNRLLHEPTARLRIQASEGNGHGYAHAVRELFALNSLDDLECGSNHQNCHLECILPGQS